MSTQKPSIGRVVHFQHGDTPCAADVLAVNPDGSLALLVKPPNQQPYTTDNVEQAPEGATESAKWNWPPRA
ncbi:hypothetical protein [Corallococcus sp. EGB]|uniref:hypothetical protein n=1 Tax=Corallococcus sp. EGB TaxID=1521117 RepID=UPI001CBAEAC6|nr:hypothetical protein [Corallococcus sp. EGB]